MENVKNNYYDEFERMELKNDLSEACNGKILREICDISLDKVYSINELQTRLLRKRLGVFNEGKVMSIRDIASYYEMEEEFIEEQLWYSLNRLLSRFHGVPLVYLQSATDYKDLPFSKMSDKAILNLQLSPVFFNKHSSCFQGKWDYRIKQVLDMDINAVYSMCWHDSFLIDWLHSLGFTFKMDKLILELDDLYKKRLTESELLNYNLLFCKGFFSDNLYYDVLGKQALNIDGNYVSLNKIGNIINCEEDSIRKMPNVNERTLRELKAFISTFGYNFASKEVNEVKKLIKKQ